MPGWTKHNLESRLLGEISTSDMQTAQRITKQPLDESERELKKLALRSTFRKLKSRHLVLSLHRNKWENKINS